MALFVSGRQAALSLKTLAAIVVIFSWLGLERVGIAVAPTPLVAVRVSPDVSTDPGFLPTFDSDVLSDGLDGSYSLL